MKRALILGIGGQDGSYLAEILREHDYEIHGVYRRSSVDNLTRIEKIRDRIYLHQGDLSDGASIHRVIANVRPTVIYNMADQDHVDWSFNLSGQAMDITAGAVARTLESIREIDSDIKFFQPVSALMFGAGTEIQTEKTPFAPASPYAVAKTAAYYLCQYYRREHGLRINVGIMYNHDSVRRGKDYLLHRIALEALKHEQSCYGRNPYRMQLGGLNTVVDIGCAHDYMKQVVRLMEVTGYAGVPGINVIIASGKPTTIGGLIQVALEHLALPHSEEEVRDRVQETPYTRKGKVPTLVGDTSYAQFWGLESKRTAADVLLDIIDHYRV